MVTLMQGFILQIKKILLFITLSTLFLSLTCWLPYPQIGIVVGLFVGWLAIFNIYVFTNSIMTITSDVVYAIFICMIIYLSVILSGFWCDIFLKSLECKSTLQSACAFGIGFPVFISTFSLWLWLRLTKYRKDKST